MSAGLEVDRLQGGFRRRTPTDLDFPAISCDAALSASLRYEDRLPEGKEAYAQFALLYTSPEGSRRIRVHTLGLPVAGKLTHVFKGADLDAQMAALARSVAAKLPGGTLAAAREVGKPVITPCVDLDAHMAEHAPKALSPIPCLHHGRLHLTGAAGAGGDGRGGGRAGGVPATLRQPVLQRAADPARGAQAHAAVRARAAQEPRARVRPVLPGGASG